MSWDYGWNAQSAFLPQEKKYIKVSDKGMQKLTAISLQYKPKNNEQASKGNNLLKDIKSKKQVKRNKGIQQRMKRDQQSIKSDKLYNDQSYINIQRQLQKKTKIYDGIQKQSRNHSLFLVDFQEKKLLKEDQEFEELKKQFYEGKYKQILTQQQQLNQQGGTQQYLRQNLAWEKQILAQLKGDIISGKQKVSQSFDRKLTEQQKQALQKVIQERLKQKKRITQIRTKRQQEQLNRLRKLRKLDILDDQE